MVGEAAQILLIEDNSGDILLFREALQRAELDFELTVIRDGGDAIAVIRGEGEHAASPLPDLVVLDVNLPKHDGFEVLEAMRQSQRFTNIPAVIISSAPVPPPDLKADQFQAAKFITKPLTLEEFLRIGDVLKENVLASKAKRASDS